MTTSGCISIENLHYSHHISACRHREAFYIYCHNTYTVRALRGLSSTIQEWGPPREFGKRNKRLYYYLGTSPHQCLFSRQKRASTFFENRVTIRTMGTWPPSAPFLTKKKREGELQFFDNLQDNIANNRILTWWSLIPALTSKHCVRGSESEEMILCLLFFPLFPEGSTRWEVYGFASPSVFSLHIKCLRDINSNKAVLSLNKSTEYPFVHCGSLQ